MELWLILLLSLALGAIFVASGFGFSSAWRLLIEQTKTHGARLQLLLLAILSILLFPILGEQSGQVEWAIQPFVRPLSVSVVVGGFVFGVGMQLAGSCTSGSLGNAGRGHWNGWLALVMMIVGATLAAFHFEWWQAQLSAAPVSWLEYWGWQSGLVITLLGLVAGYWWLYRLELNKHGLVEPILIDSASFAGVVAIAVLLTLLTLWQGHPWGVTVPFATVGIHVMDFLGFQQWTFWGFSAEYAHIIEQPLWQEPMTLTLFGFIVGASIAQYGLKKKACVALIKQPLSGGRNYLLVIVGGLMMGYAGIIGFGCNIGALVSGFASASLHSLLWLIFALLGSWAGLRLRAWVVKPAS